MIGPFRQRSSWPSSFVTGLIGWVGVAVLGSLAFSYRDDGRLYAVAAALGVAQILVMKSGFPLSRPVSVSVAAGALLGTALVVAASLSVAGLPPLWMVAGAGAFIGGNVGGYLGYFERDDGRVMADARARGVPGEYGRDAHWLDPFAYGAAAYLIAFVPRSVPLAVSAAAVGAMVGVVAAATSHFILGRAGNAGWTIPVAAVVGAAIGAASGWLFRGFDLLLPWPAHGAIAGFLAFAATAAVGRVLARKERGE